MLKDAKSYEKLCRESFSEYNKDSPEYVERSPDQIDFERHCVVGIFWGGQPNTGYRISVLSVTAKGREVTITVKTEIAGYASQMLTYPNFLMVIPKTDDVKVIVKGDRLPRDHQISDFANRREDGLEVVVSRWW